MLKARKNFLANCKKIPNVALIQSNLTRKGSSQLGGAYEKYLSGEVYQPPGHATYHKLFIEITEDYKLVTHNLALKEVAITKS